MLRYQIKLNDGNIVQEEMVWQEKYVAQDLSFVSGVTSPSYHLENYDTLQTSNYLTNSPSMVNVVSENVQRQGFVIVKGKQYPISTTNVVDYVDGNKNVKYILVNGKYYYETSRNGSNCFVIPNGSILAYDGISVLLNSNDLIVPSNGGNAMIDMVYWIEDGFVRIDDEDYFYDKNESITDQSYGYNGQGVLKYTEDGYALQASKVTACDSIDFHPYSSSNKYEVVTKFTLTTNGDTELNVVSASYGGYYYYVKYKDYYCQVKLDYDSSTYICEVPKCLLSGDTISSDLTPSAFTVSYVTELSESDDEQTMDEDGWEIATTSVFQDLYDFNDYVKTVKIDKDRYFVENNIINTVQGRELLIELEDGNNSVDVGSQIIVLNRSDSPYYSLVYNDPSSEIEGSDGAGNGLKSNRFIVYGGCRYSVIDNLCDQVLINDVEYPITYINGKVVGVDCLVSINGEDVPMKILSLEQLQRYGVTLGENGVSAYTYTIKPYDGVEIDGVKYPIENRTSEYNGHTLGYEYAVLDGIPNKMSLSVIDKIGSSLFLCEPTLNKSEVSSSLTATIATAICDEIMDGWNGMSFIIPNKAFGLNPITPQAAFTVVNSPTSSDDYFNLFESLVIYVRNGHITLSLPLGNSVGGNPLQDDVVERDFFEAEKKKAIPSIVDMEKDVYIPKVINGTYVGSNTNFEPIYEIDVNLHFRTRDLDSWKVNDGYNDVSTSGSSDNWFVTDYHPYRDLITANKADSLMEMSDLMGLLNFTNDDIFYQKSKVGRSFLRFSYYDSIDPQTQSLLATSCVFVDEHALYKKYIDNSRKNVNDYGMVTKYVDDADSGTVLNKISVTSEYLGKKGDGSGYESIKFEMSNDAIEALSTDSNRISSRFIIKNKYESDTSSEGFYIYIFREYAENLHPKPIYMKVEFNHAGVGRTIPFVIPMNWETNGGKRCPTTSLTLSSDLEKMKKGFKLSDTYAQTYIPLYAVYDFKNKEYCYVFDNRYVTVQDGTARLNMFEMKIMDESSTVSEDVVSATIDVNSKQFPDNICNN